MSISRHDVEYVARLSRLDLDEETIEKMTQQVGQILDYISKLNELDTKNVEPMSHPSSLQNVLREDEPRRSLDRDDSLLNAPDRFEGFFKVPRVIE